MVHALWQGLLPFFAGAGVALAITICLVLARVRNAEETVAEIRRQLEHAERVASLGTLAAGAAHEINNPLTVVAVSLATLESELPGPGDVMDPARRATIDEILADATEGAFLAGRIVKDLTAFASPHAEDTELVALAESVGDTLRMLNPLLRNCAVLEETHEPAPLVRASRVRIYQVLVNVIRNAIEAMPQGNPKNRIRIRTGTAPNGHGFVRIEDNGPGILQDALPRIYEPFFTTKRSGVGTGLGLSVCNGIVTSLGGKIEVENRIGEGVAFVIHLPAAPGADATGGPRPSALE